MSFKNAFLIMTNRFGLVWSLLLYFLVFAFIITGLSLPFIIPLTRALDRAGIFALLNASLSNTAQSGLLPEFMAELIGIFGKALDVIGNSRYLLSLTVGFGVMIAVVYRFLLGLYEIPMLDVLYNWMNSSARYGLFGRLFSNLWLSMRFVLAKMIYTLLFDAVLCAIIYGLMSVIGTSWLILTATVLVFILLMSFRFSIISSWGARVVNGSGIFAAFKDSAKLCFKNFGPVFSNFFITWVLIVAVNLFLGVFTFGAGLLAALPMSTMLLCCLNLTTYFNKTGMRYYVSGNIVTPPVIGQKSAAEPLNNSKDKS